jgi:hypothetical protein
MRRFLAGLVLTAGISTSGVVVAQNQSPGDLTACPDTPAILATADYLLAEFQTTKRFWHDLEGSDAAYAKIRYGDLRYAEAQQLLTALSLRQHRPLRIEELSLAHLTSAERTAALTSIDTAPIVWGTASVWRALMVVDGGDWLFGELARWRETAPADLARASDQIAVSVADLGDEALGKLASRAEGLGLWRLASRLLARRSNLAELVALINRMPEYAFEETSGTIEEKRVTWLRTNLYSSYLGYAPLDVSVQPPEVKAILEKPFQAAMMPFGPLIGHAPDTAVLMSLLNMTGEMRIASEVAQGLLLDIEAGRLDPVGAPDAVTTSMMERLDKVLGKKSREQLLASIPPGGGSIFYHKDLADHFDRAVARHALAGFLRGEISAAPARPATLRSALDWDRWVKIAGDLLANRTIDEADRLIATDLLMAAGRPAAALDSLGLSASQEDARPRAWYLMHRLDRRCGDVFRRPLPVQEHVYRFDRR